MSDELAERVEQLADRVEAVEEELEDEKEKRRAAEERVEELQEWKEEHKMKHGAMGSWLDAIEDDLEGLESQVEAVDTATADLAQMNENDLAGMLPIEQLARLPESVAKEQLDTPQSRNLYRARFVWKNFDSYATRVGDAESRRLRITSAEMIRVLRAAEEGNSGIESKTTERVMERMVDWTHGLAEIDVRDGERRLYLPADWAEKKEEATRQATLDGESPSDGAVSGRR